MSCGCKGVAVPLTIEATVVSRTGKAVTPDSMTAAAMCTACPIRRERACGTSGKTVVAHIKAVDCPDGRHPKAGIVRWLGVDWYGVPYPLRVYLWLGGKVTTPASLPDCGCIVVIKDAWVRLGLMLRSS